MSMFHYVTYKYIIIKDRRLGIAYYGLAAAIILYTLVQLVVNKAYLEFDTSPEGSFRLIVTVPPGSNIPSDGLPAYCVPAKPNEGVCESLDGLSLTWPVESNAVTISTFIKEKWEVRNITESDRYKFTRERNYFSLLPEVAVVKVEHAISASHDSYAASHRMMTGKLVSHDGQVTKRFHVGDSSGVDKIKISEFLEAAGIDSLDKPSDAVSASNRTYRENGIVLRVIIDYRNAEATFFGTSNTEYTYRVRHVPYSDYRIRETVPVITPADFDSSKDAIARRVVRKRYATRIEFSQAGKIGLFSLPKLLLQLVSAMGLLTLTATIIDLVALYVIPNKEDYRQYVFDASPEFQRSSTMASNATAMNEGKTKSE